MYQLIVLAVIIVCCPVYAQAASFLRTDNAQAVNAAALNETTQQTGVIVTLEAGDRFSFGGVEYKASENSILYITQSTPLFSVALLDGDIMSNQEEDQAKVGQVYVFDSEKNETDIYDFDVAHFLKTSKNLLSPETHDKLKKIISAQSRQKFFGFLRTSNMNVQPNNNPSRLNNIAPASGNDNIFDLIQIVQNINDDIFADVVADTESVNDLVGNFSFIDDLSSIFLFLQWGAGARDLDIHLTGPDGSDSRFHVFYRDLGSLDSAPNAALIDDCISTTCSEVIEIRERNENPNGENLYRASVHNFADQNPDSTNLSNEADAELRLIVGGTYVPREGDTDTGGFVDGGTTVFTTTPATDQAGNTWQAIEFDSITGEVFEVNEITSFDDPGDVQ